MISLPISLHRGRVVRVVRPDRINVLLDLGFSVHVEREIAVAGIDARAFAGDNHSLAMRCMVVLLGGSEVIVHTADATSPHGLVLGRVYLSRPVFDPPVKLHVPPGMEEPMLELSSYFSWLRENQFNHLDIIAMVRGKAKV